MHALLLFCIITILIQSGCGGTDVQIPFGESAEFDGLRVAILNKEEKDRIYQHVLGEDMLPAHLSPKAEEGTKFLVVEVLIENINNTTINYTADMRLGDKQGNEYEPDVGGFMKSFIPTAFIEAELKPHVPQIGYSIYRIPKDAEANYLINQKNGNQTLYFLLE